MKAGIEAASANLRDFCLAIAEHAPLPMAAVEGDGHVLRYVNPAYCRLMNKPAEQLVGKSFREMRPEKNECLTLLDRVYRTGKPESHTEKQDSGPHPNFRSYTMWPVFAEERPVGIMLQVTETAQFHEQTVAMNEALMLGSVRQHELTEAAESLNSQLQEEIRARQKTARELSEKARLLDLSNDAIIVRDLDGKISSWNKGAENLYGWACDEAIGKHLDTLLKTEFPKPAKEIGTQLHSEGKFSGEVVQTTRDGRRVHALCRRVLDRRTELVLTSYTDITERQLAEQKFQGLLESAPDAMIITNQEGEITLINAQTEKLFDYSRGELIGKRIEVLIPQRFREHHPENRHGFLADPLSRPMGTALDLWALRKDGTEFPVEISLSPLKTDSGTLVTAAVRDITERKKLEGELSEKARLLDLSNDAIIVRDLSDKISSWNRGAERLYGWTSEEVIGKHLDSLLRMEFPKPLEEILAQLESEGQFSGEIVQITRDGRRVHALCRWVLDRSTDSILTSYTDITERKQMEQALDRAQSQLADRADLLEQLVTERTEELTATNKQLEAFVYSIAHDLRAPLRSMQGYSVMLIEDTDSVLSETGRDFANHINKSAQFLDALLRDLVAFSGIAQRKMDLTPVDLETVVQSVLSDLEKEIRGKNGRVEIIGPWPAALAHEPTVDQILFNLVSNALKFSAPNVPPLVQLRAEEQAEFIRVWVEDNGIGIAPAYQDQIFRLFTRLDGDKYAGTGIGLAIAQKGIERMGGRVGVESAFGQGSRFWFELKRARRFDQIKR